MVNKVILIGNVGKDPIIRNVNESTPVASFTLATNEVYKDSQGNLQKNTEWHNIVAWRNLAQLAEKYIRKGSQIYVEGRLKSRTYTDKDNQQRTIVEILADKIQLLGKKEGDENNTTTHVNTDTTTNMAGNINETINEAEGGDLPF
ncbi:MAG TPA: single-stranded DNA-binding protein [Bacteroidales bacterium]|jgi:single-strand DNA-binding protein|nr:single-stranded DNA-binding protein [Bacteroidales bacterium]HOU97770.1 single-stranded DNA-binding protein [Bacteroidales bacterium]